MQWYYAKNGGQLGPVDTVDIQAKLMRGEIIGTDLVWNQQMTDWTEAAKVPELAQFATPPPEPGPPAEQPPAGEAPEGVPPQDDVPAEISPYAPPVAEVAPQTPHYPVPAQAVGCGKATASMVLGICGICFSLCCCIGLILSILAVVYGKEAQRIIERNPQFAYEAGKAKTGITCGWIGIGISALTIVWHILSGVASYSAHSF